MTRIQFKIPTPLKSFLGMDLKLGASIISLFAVLNKVAGAYGMMAVLGGGALEHPLLQTTMYLYSLGTLFVVLWGLKKISEENGPQTLLYAHLFAIDHFISTIYTALFAVIWYVYVPHDGRRVANSDAQKEMMGAGNEMDDAARLAAAQGVWKSERGFSAVVLLVGWGLKIYFILILYSFALHLRRNSYHNLPKSRARGISATFATNPSSSSGGSSRVNHTRHSSTGGPRYTHLRGVSIASTVDSNVGTETTLAETLWEEEDYRPARIDMEVVNAKDAAGASGSGSGNGGGVEPFSPAVAKGTGMIRSLSGGVLQRTDSGEAVRSGSSTTENNFSRILSQVK